MESLILFPVIIGTTDVADLITNEHKKIMAKMEYFKNQGNHFTKETYVLNRPELSDLKVSIQEKINEHFVQEYRPKHDLRLKITQSWLNVTMKGEFHHEHSHSNSAFSAVIYLNVVEGDVIEFHHPVNPTIAFESTEYNLANSKTWALPVKMNQMIIFPSWLRHSVPKKEIEGQRISMAINTFYEGSLGNENTLTALTVHI